MDSKISGQGQWPALLGKADLVPESRAEARSAELEKLVSRVQLQVATQQSVVVLGQHEQQFYRIFNQTSQLMWILSPDGTLLEVNQTALIFAGLQLADVKGCAFWQTRWWGSSPEAVEQLQKVIAAAATGHSSRYAVDILGIDNTVTTLDFSLKPIESEVGCIVQLLAEGHDITNSLQVDITQHKQAEVAICQALAQEKELCQLRSRWVCMVSHELRKPLNNISLAVSALQSYGQRWSNEKKLKYMDRIQTAVSRMNHLLTEVLTVGRADAGIKCEPKPLDLIQFCQELVAEIQLETGNQHPFTFVYQDINQELKATNPGMVDREPATPPSSKPPRRFSLDEKLLQPILTNLLSNAIKYSSLGSPVSLEVTNDKRQVIFRIQDQGIGIPLGDKQNLFEPFHRAKNVGDIPGTGLGLAIVKKFTNLHGGKIACDSVVGIGTTFTVKLPINGS